MAFTVSSTKSTSGRREGKMNGQDITEVTTFLTSEFRHGPCRSRQDESGTGRELAPWLQDSPPQAVEVGKDSGWAGIGFPMGLCYF